MRLGPRAAVLSILSILIASSMAGVAASASPFSARPVNCAILDHATDMGTCISYAIPLAAIGIILSLVIVAVTYMLGEVIQLESLKGWYKNELKETAKSAMVIVIVIAVLALLSGIASLLSGAAVAASTGPSAIQSNLGNLYNAASGYLSAEQGVASEAFSYITGVSLGIAFIKSFTLALWTPFPVVPIPVPPYAAVFFHFGFLTNIYTSSIIDTTSPTGTASLAFIRDAFNLLVMPMYLAFTVQLDLLSVIMQVGLLLFLPIGIILRAIPFVRGIGGTLIAIGIAFSLIYPTTLVVLNVPVTGQLATSYVPAQACSGPPLFGGFLCAISSGIMALIPNGVGFAYGVASLTSIYPAFNGVQYYLYPLIVQLVLLLLDLAIVIIMAQNIANLLGGSIRFGVGGRLKLA